MNSGFPAGRVDLDRLRRGPVDWSGELPAESGLWGLPELRFAGAPRLEFRAEPGGHGGVRVKGRLMLTLGVECGRCLKEVDWPLEIEFDFRFDPSVRESDEEEGVFALDAEAPDLDLIRPLREELALASPEYPVCQDGCLGLCPICGADLNESVSCGCSRAEPDPRWDVLRTLVSDGQPGAAAADDEDQGNDG
jgi:uncharacterized protein